MFVWNSSSPGGPAQTTSKPTYTSFSRVHDSQPVEWNEELQLDAVNPSSEVLTVQVKDSTDALVGSCNIYLAHLRPGHALDQWFQLHPAGLIHLKLVLAPNQRPIPTPVTGSPYSPDFQALIDLEMKKIAGAVNKRPSNATSPCIAMLLEAQNQAQQNAMLMINQCLQQQQQPASQTLSQAQSSFPVGFPASYPQAQQQSNGTNFHEMMGTVANISTTVTNMQQLNGDPTGGIATSGLGTVASIGLGALGLGPFGAFFGA